MSEAKHTPIVDTVRENARLWLDNSDCCEPDQSCLCPDCTLWRQTIVVCDAHAQLLAACEAALRDFELVNQYIEHCAETVVSGGVPMIPHTYTLTPKQLAAAIKAAKGG